MNPITGDTTMTSPGAPPLYRTGTLTYTRFGLLTLFVWLLWGDFWFNLMEFLIPTLLPISLNKVGASNTLIGIVIGSIPNVMTMLVNPFISTASDRHRSRWGRRIPFLVFGTPFVTFFLIVVGYADFIGPRIHGLIGHWLPLSPSVTIMVLLCACAVGFQFFNMFVAGIYNYLWADVVPEPLMGRFIALFRVVAQGAGVIWNLWIFGYVDTRLSEIYAGLALAYLVSFSLMCWRVKEGHYPPPPPRPEGAGLSTSIKIYFRECFSIPFYLWFFAIYTLRNVSSCCDTFHIFFVRDVLGISYQEFGHMLVITGIYAMVLILIMGWLCDKIHPMRMTVIGTVLFSLVSFTGRWIIYDKTSLLVFMLVTIFANVWVGVAQLPLYVIILPKNRFGQFCSAMGLVSSMSMIVGNALGGIFMDLVHDYRYLFIWRGVFSSASFIPLLVVYLAWKRGGGTKGFVPPLADASPPAVAQPQA